MKFTSEDLDSDNTWQIGTGDDTRGFADIFFKYGVALVGPGDPGREGDNETATFYEQDGSNNWGAVLKQVACDDWLIARKGKRAIVAVGRVVKEYDYSTLFDDVQGWDLQHFVKVKWYRPTTQDNVLWLENYILSQSTLQGCHKLEVYDAIYQMDFEECPPVVDIDTVSLPTPLVLSDINTALVDLGVRIQDADNISETLKKNIRLTEWYLSNDGKASEYELVCFLIVPFLIALGWSEQKIKIEYNNIDVAIFSKSFTGNYSEEPEIIVEAKKFNNGLAFTDNQVSSYSKSYPSCNKFIVTNGYRYKYFQKVDGQLACMGSINLRMLRNIDPLYDYKLNTIETLLAISNL